MVLLKLFSSKDYQIIIALSVSKSITFKQNVPYICVAVAAFLTEDTKITTIIYKRKLAPVTQIKQN